MVGMVKQPAEIEKVFTQLVRHTGNDFLTNVSQGYRHYSISFSARHVCEHMYSSVSNIALCFFLLW